MITIIRVLLRVGTHCKLLTLYGEGLE